MVQLKPFLIAFTAVCASQQVDDSMANAFVWVGAFVCSACRPHIVFIYVTVIVNIQTSSHKKQQQMASVKTELRLNRQ